MQVEQTEVQAIGIDKRLVETAKQRFSYDYLIVALGAELVPGAIPGLDSAHTFYTFEGALKLRDALQDFRGGVIAIVVGALPYKCPGAPHEGAMLLADFFRRRGLQRNVEIHLFTPEPQPMPVAGPALGDAVKKMLELQGVQFHPQYKLASVNPQTRELIFEGGNSFKYDLLVAIPPHRAPRVIQESGLVNGAGWIPVDKATLATRWDDVYALGDVTAVPIPGRWKPDVPLMLPKAGVFAHAQAKIVARRIRDEIAGLPQEAQFSGIGYCMLESGGGRAGMAFGNFFAEPSPNVQLRNVGRNWHWAKVLFEQWWLTPYGLRRELLGGMLTLASRLARLPVSL